MDISALIMQLDDDDQAVRTAAADTLVRYGADAVPALVSVLRRGDRPSGHPYPYRLAGGVQQVLHAIGEPALEPLTEALAEAEERSQVVDLGSALTGLRLPDPAAYLPLLRHPSGSVRDRVLIVFEDLGREAVRYLEDVLPLLSDPYDDVRGRAEMALRAMGSAAVPRLRELRSSAAPVRRQALTALVEVGGWAALAPADQALLRRLIRITMSHEVPEPMQLCGHWYALPTSDQAAVLEALDLPVTMPVTMRLGEAAWHADHHSFDNDNLGSRVYVTPALDGWTLVFGHYPSDGSGDWQDVLRTLSRQFGAAHWYYVFEGCTGWAMAEHGELLRYYDNEEPEEQIGPPHPAEKGYLLPHEDPYPDDAFDDVPRGDSEAFGARMRQLKAELNIPDECWATDVARQASVDPESIGPHTRVAGHGVVAATAEHSRVGARRGVLPI